MEDAAKGEPAAGRDFFDYPGPLFSALISPSSVVVKVNAEKGFRCVARDKSRRAVEEGLRRRWRISDGEGRLSAESGEIVTFHRSREPGLSKLEAEVSQGEIVLRAEALITISQTLVERDPGRGQERQGSAGLYLPASAR